MRLYKCLDDALQRAYYRVTQIPGANSTEVKLVEQLESRLALIISATGASTTIFWVRPTSLGAAIGGIQRTNNGYPSLELYNSECGGLQKVDWWGYQQNGSALTFWIVEAIGPPMTDENSYEE